MVVNNLLNGITLQVALISMYQIEKKLGAYKKDATEKA